MEARKAVEYKPFMGLRDAATYTGLSYEYLRTGCNDGEIPHIKSGRKIIINMNRFLDDLNALPSERIQKYRT